MPPVSAASTGQFVNQARQQGQALQQQYGQQAQQAQGTYNQAAGQASQAGQNYQQYLQNLPQAYTQDMGQVGSMMGYNPQTTQNAARNLTASENIMNALPQAVNQMGNYSGATAGQIAGNYGNMAGNISGQVTNANNALQNQLGMLSQMQQAAQNITGQQTTGMGQAYSTAVSQMGTAGQVMQQIEQLQQQQGNLTAEQVAAYQNAYSTYIQSAAQAQNLNLISQGYQRQLDIPVGTPGAVGGATGAGGQPAPPTPNQAGTNGDDFTRFSENAVTGAGNLLGGIGRGLGNVGQFAARSSPMFAGLNMLARR